MIVALTGSIGCGKSTALTIFSDMGWTVLDADKICHDLYETNSIELQQLFDGRWGKGCVVNKEGGIDRQKVAQIVFNDKEELSWLNKIFHPLVWSHAQKAKDNGENVIFDIPLLFEVGWENEFDAVIALWTPYVIQKKRLVERGWSDDEISGRISSQIDAETKLERADYGLINNGTKKNLKKQCIYLNKQLRTI